MILTESSRRPETRNLISRRNRKSLSNSQLWVVKEAVNFNLAPPTESILNARHNSTNSLSRLWRTFPLILTFWSISRDWLKSWSTRLRMIPMPQHSASGKWTKILMSAKGIWWMSTWLLVTLSRGKLKEVVEPEEDERWNYNIID